MRNEARSQHANHSPFVALTELFPLVNPHIATSTKIVQLNDPTEDHSTVDRLLRVTSTEVYGSLMPLHENDQGEIVEFEYLTILPKHVPMSSVVWTTPQVAQLLDISDATLRGWIARKHFPPKDGDINGKTPYWKAGTVFEYLRNAPGGRLGYPVG